MEEVVDPDDGVGKDVDEPDADDAVANGVDWSLDEDETTGEADGDDATSPCNTGGGRPSPSLSLVLGGPSDLLWADPSFLFVLIFLRLEECEGLVGGLGTTSKEMAVSVTFGFVVGLAISATARLASIKAWKYVENLP